MVKHMSGINLPEVITFGIHYWWKWSCSTF